MIVLGIFKAIGLSILLIVISIILSKLISKNARFGLIHLLASCLIVIVSTILLSVYFYSKSIESFVGSIKQTACQVVYENYTAESQFGSTKNIDYKAIKETLKREYPIIGNKLDNIAMPDTNIDSDGDISVQAAVAQVIDHYFGFITRKLKMIEYCMLISVILLQLIFIAVMLRQKGTHRMRTARYDTNYDIYN